MHPHMKVMIIKRHDDAVWAIYWALASSKRGNAKFHVDLKDPVSDVVDVEDDVAEGHVEFGEEDLHDHAPRSLPGGGASDIEPDPTSQTGFCFIDSRNRSPTYEST